MPATTRPDSTKTARTGTGARLDAKSALYSSRPRSISPACSSVGSSTNSKPNAAAPFGLSPLAHEGTLTQSHRYGEQPGPPTMSSRAPRDLGGVGLGLAYVPVSLSKAPHSFVNKTEISPRSVYATHHEEPGGGHDFGRPRHGKDPPGTAACRLPARRRLPEGRHQGDPLRYPGPRTTANGRECWERPPSRCCATSSSRI